MTMTLTVSGMSCEGCESAVANAVSTVSGVTDVTADHEQGTVTVDGDPDPEEVVAAISAAGYRPA